jgi:hypothetical protein
MTTNPWVFPTAAIKLGIGRADGFRTDAQHRAEGVERVETAVKPERVFVQIGLQVLGADAVVTALQPGFQVAENQMDDGQIVLGDRRIVSLDNWQMFVSPLLQRGIARRTIGEDHRTRCYGAFDEADKRLGRTIRHHFHAQPTGIASATTGLRTKLRFTLADLDGGNNERLIMDATAKAARRTANPSFIDLDMPIQVAANAVTVRANHTGAQLVEDLEGRLVAGQAKLALKLDRAQSRRVAGDQIGCPEPRRERHAGALHDAAGGQANVATAATAAQDVRAVGEAKRLGLELAMGAAETLFPPQFFKVFRAGSVVRKELLKLRERAREGQTLVLEDVSGHCLSPQPYEGRSDGGTACIGDVVIVPLVAGPEKTAPREEIFRVAVGHYHRRASVFLVPHAAGSFAVTTHNLDRTGNSVLQDNDLSGSQPGSTAPFGFSGEHGSVSTLLAAAAVAAVGPGANAQGRAVLEANLHARDIFHFESFNFVLPVALKDIGCLIASQGIAAPSFKAELRQVSDCYCRTELLGVGVDGRLKAGLVVCHLKSPVQLRSDCPDERNTTTGICGCQPDKHALRVKSIVATDGTKQPLTPVDATGKAIIVLYCRN